MVGLARACHRAVQRGRLIVPNSAGAPRLGRLRPLAARQPQMDPQRSAATSILPAFELVEYGEVLARRLLQPEHVDAVHSAPGSRRSLRWSASASADETVGRSRRAIMPWKSSVEALELPDVEGGVAAAPAALPCAWRKRGRLRAVQPEARRQQRGGLEQQAELVAFGQRLGPSRRAAGTARTGPARVRPDCLPPVSLALLVPSFARHCSAATGRRRSPSRPAGAPTGRAGWHSASSSSSALGRSAASVACVARSMASAIAGFGFPAHDALLGQQAQRRPHRRARDVAERGDLLLGQPGAGARSRAAAHIENALREIKMVGARASGSGLHGVS